MNDFYDYPSGRYLKEESEKKAIKYISRVAGLCCVAYVVVQTIMSALLLITPIGKIYDADPTMQSVVNIFSSICCLLIPFALGGILIGRQTGKSVFEFNKPVSTSLMLWAVPFGFFICLVGNQVTSWFVNFMTVIGVNLTAPDFQPPADFAGRILYAVSIAVVPALVEEFAIRGVIMQPLRKYGDKFAIVASAIIFAVLHGNLIQAPFALIAGIGIGYAVCITNSIWTGILIHFVNNLFSVVTEFMVADIQNEAVLNITYNMVMIILCALSVFGSVVFLIKKERRKLVPSFTVLKERKKMTAFIFTLPMLIALFIMYRITSTFVSIG